MCDLISQTSKIGELRSAIAAVPHTVVLIVCLANRFFVRVLGLAG